MAKRVIILVVVLVVGIFAYVSYNRYDARRAGVSGEVFSNDPQLARAKMDSVSRAAAESTGPWGEKQLCIRRQQRHNQFLRQRLHQHQLHRRYRWLRRGNQRWRPLREGTRSVRIRRMGWCLRARESIRSTGRVISPGF